MKPQVAIKKGNTIYRGNNYTSILMRERSVNLRGGVRGLVDEQGKFIPLNNNNKLEDGAV